MYVNLFLKSQSDLLAKRVWKYIIDELADIVGVFQVFFRDKSKPSFEHKPKSFRNEKNIIRKINW